MAGKGRWIYPGGEWIAMNQIIKNIVPAAGAWLSLWLLLAAQPSVASGQSLVRYKFKPEQAVSYDVKITAILGDVREVREGTLTLAATEATDQQMTLKATGSLNVRRQSRDGNPVIVMPNFRFGPPVGDFISIRQSPFSIDKTGRVTDIEVQTALPYMLGDFEQLVLDELPAKASEKSWKREREVVVSKQARTSPFPRTMRPRGFGPPGRFGPPGFNDEENENEKRSATEMVTWEVQGNEDGQLQIQKNYSLKTDDKVGGKPRRSMTGEGEQTFNPARGLWKSGLMQYTVEINDDNVALSIPVSVSFRLLSEAESKNREKLAIEARKKAEMAQAKAAEEARPKPLSVEERKQLLAELKSADDQALQKSGDRLARVPQPDKPDAELAAALADATARTTGFPRSSLAKALAVWATPAQEKELVRLVTTNDFLVRPAAISGLARMKSPKAAKILANLMNDLASRTEAAKGLKAMGADVAEPELIPLLKSPDLFTRGEVARILQEIGTPKSLPALKELLGSSQPFAEQAAKSAISAIELREAAK